MDSQLLYNQLKADGYNTLITKREYLEITGISKSTLDLNISQHRNIPNYIKFGDPINGRVMFNLQDVCDFICYCTVKVA